VPRNPLRARSILHRDLKPANILLDGGGRPRDGSDSRSARRQPATQTGMIVSASYMSPEQAAPSRCR
jgi:serine/threonine-protein kinase